MPDTTQPSFFAQMEEVAKLAVFRAIPSMDDTDAGEVSYKMKMTHKNGKRYQATITVCELDADGSPAA